MIFLSATIFQIIVLQFAASHKDYAVKYFFWKFPVHSDTSCRLCISWFYNDCFQKVCMQRTLRNIEAMRKIAWVQWDIEAMTKIAWVLYDPCEAWVHCTCVNLRQEDLGVNMRQNMAWLALFSELHCDTW